MAENEANQVNVALVSSANASHNIAIDTKSPYFLHSSDHPGLTFVTHPLNENGENYFTWRRSFLNALRSKNKAGFLTNALAKEIQSSAAHADTAHEVWADLQERFTQGIAPLIYELRRAIALLQQEKSSISSYYAKKMEDMREQEKVFDFLMGLDDTFSIDLPSRRPIGVGRVRDGLYYLEPIREGKALMASNMRHADMWHWRLGHLPMNRLSFIGDLSINVKENKFCDACCRARQHRLPIFANHLLFLFHRGPAFIAILIYVDDVIITGNDSDRIVKLKCYLDKKFRIKDLGKLKYFLGIEVARSPSVIVLSQHKTDISYVVHLLSQFMHNPRQPHLNAVFCELRYLKNAPGQGLLLPSNNSLSLRAYCDGDWAGCPTTRRSTTGYIIFLGSSPISWRLKKQTVVSRSSAEAEYRAMATTSTKIIWLIRLLRDLQVPCSNPVPLFCDNQAAIHIAANPVFHERTKHVEIDCHFVHQHIQSQTLIPRPITSKFQLADIFTKALGRERFHELLSKLGVSTLHTPT
ncbi:Cysteine-rich RLK (RECEPTOR-like protein kinase) 8 [Theobroma cacao]|uniref:Cysteine-rich RLK (RECEPTOR-like protein kinase) 8 n=1 Tax=Theobroma cacao TaxID=3641 RepID=A0A061F412_THECC|nr:Cysteine-rich RLK (RECEPTOR-like protein kinase) 8 [Theobroma cacao]